MSMKKLMATRQGAIVVAMALLVGVAALALVGCAAQPTADPMQVTEAHVVAESAAVSADVAAWIAEQHPLTRAVGAEAIDAAIAQDDIEWRYEPPIDEGGDRFAIRAYADFGFRVNNPQGGRAVVAAAMPYDIIVDARAGSVLSMDAVYSDGYLGLGGDYEFEDADQ